MSELLTKAAAVMGVPEPLVKRAAEARAAATGAAVDDVLAAWAGGESVAGSGPESEPTPPPVETAPPPVETGPPQDETAPPSTMEGPVPEPERAVGAVTRAPAPTEVSAAQAAAFEEVVTVPTAGIRERIGTPLPRWLVGALLAFPVVALLALGGSETGDCGEATELRTDVVSGQIVNCDGSEFTGSGVGGGSTDFIALGERIYTGAEGGANCAGCHGVGGGGGAGPPLNGVLVTFGSCSSHLEWVSLGTVGFQAAGRSTYGDAGKPVGGAGVMPGFTNLTEEQLAAVSAFERVRFGGADIEATLTECGLAEEPAEGEPPVDGEEAPAEDGESPAEGGEAGAGHRG